MSRAHPRRTDPNLAATALAMHDMGYTYQAASQATGIPENTVWGLLHGGHKWVDGPVLRERRRQAKEVLQARSMAISERCLNQVTKKLPKASAYQAAGIYGLLRTHERLDAGEPTEVVGVMGRLEIKAEDELLRKLADTLLHSPPPEPIDVTPESNDRSK